MFIFLLIVQTLVALAMIIVILMQRSEGGGLGVGGNSSGLMSARGAADFLTRATAVLATIFVGLSILLAALAASERAPGVIDPTLMQNLPPVPTAQPQVPVADPGATPAPAPAPAETPAPATEGGVPIAQ